MSYNNHLKKKTFNGLFSRTTWVSRYQKGKTNLDFTGARDSEWQWHQLGQMQVCTSLQTDNHASTPPLCFFTGRMPFLPPNQQRQSTEGIWCHTPYKSNPQPLNVMVNKDECCSQSSTFVLLNMTTGSTVNKMIYLQIHCIITGQEEQQ